jgi:hypothetical protein
MKPRQHTFNTGWLNHCYTELGRSSTKSVSGRRQSSVGYVESIRAIVASLAWNSDLVIVAQQVFACSWQCLLEQQERHCGCTLETGSKTWSEYGRSVHTTGLTACALVHSCRE